jgi:single-strand DNA-binding protein
MARTRKTTDSVEHPENVVVELQPGIQEQEPVEQPDEAAQVSEPVDEADGEQPEPQFRSRGFSLNEVRLIGRIAKEATVHVTPGGTTVGYLRVATNGLRDGDTEFHQLTVFGKTADFAAKFLGKGRLVYVEGRLQTRRWEDPRDRITRWTTTIVVNRLQALDSRRQAADVAEQAAQ